MNQIEQTLIEQMRITESEIENRKKLFAIGVADTQVLASVMPMIESEVDALVDRFYETQTSEPEIALLIGDADTLARLRRAQHTYILDLFSGQYDIEYVNNRLRIGMVHKRIGVNPKLYLAAVQTLKELLFDTFDAHIPDPAERSRVKLAVGKLFMFDVSLVFDTYIRSLISEIEASMERSEQYARELEEKTAQLEAISRTDPLTGLLNVRQLTDTVTRVLRAAQRRSEEVSLVFVDVNDFKAANDAEGHQRGDEILCIVAEAIRNVSRMEDSCFRYGGDEFCIVMPGCTEDQAREVFGKRLMQEIHSRESGLVLSIGYAQTGPEEFMPAQDLIRLADDRMYVHKRAVKGDG